MRLKDLSIGFKISASISSLIIALFTALTIYIYSAQSKEITEITNSNMTEEVNNLKQIVQVQINERQTQIESNINVASETLNNSGELSLNTDEYTEVQAINQETSAKIYTEIPKLTIKGEPLFKSTFIVDKIKELTKAEATIFQKIDSGYLRISTTIQNESKERAINTFIPNSSEVVKTIEKGEDYLGRAVVLDKWYQTAYRPLIYNQDIIGMIFVGSEEKDMNSIKELFTNKKYYDTGFPFLVDKNGTLIIHPTIEGDNISNLEFFQEIQKDISNNGKIEYEYEGEQKSGYYSYVPEIESYIIVTVFKNEMLAKVYNMRNSLIWAMIITTLLIITAIHFLSLSLTSSIKKAVVFAKKIAEGDLTVKINLDQKDEIGMLIKALSQMIDKIREIVSNINTGAIEIASASHQISNGSQLVSQGANSQAATAEEVATSMEEMAANIDQTSNNALQTEKIASQAKSSMEQMSESGLKALDSIQNITNKISIINDIAFQTNILALNASVEAARAGEHGKGFAVVAQEVRKLAERSNIAAEEIAKLSKDSLTVSEESGIILENLTPEITRTAELIQEIAAASGEQSVGVDQVNNALNDLNQIIQQNAASSEELASNAEELASQAELLKDMVSYFKIDKK